MKTIILNFTLIVIAAIPSISQENCELKNKAFQTGEIVDYVITYNWFLVWTDVGGVRFEANNDKMFGEDVINLKATGITYTFYDWFFPVYDIYQSCGKKD